MNNKFVGIHLDFVGFLASLLCAIHCATLPLIITVSALGGLSWATDPLVEYTFLITSLVIAAITLLASHRKGTIEAKTTVLFVIGFCLLFISLLLPHVHGTELIFKILGGTSIAIAHIFHWTEVRKRTLAGASVC